MCLAFKNLKLSSIKGQQWSQSYNERTYNVSRSQKETRYVPLMQLQIKLRKTKNKVFWRKQKTNNVPPKIFRSFVVRKNIRLMYWRPNSSMIGKSHVFSDWKQRSKVCFLFFECKLEQDMYGCCISELNSQDMVEATYLRTRKQQTKYHWRF